MDQSNRIEKVAIVGATGRIGSRFAEELVKTGQHTVTALTRSGSTGTLPAGVMTVAIDYNDEASLVTALKDQQFLVITLSVRAPPDTGTKLVKAAVEAGVPYVMPNTYGADVLNERLINEDPDLYTAGAKQRCEEVKQLGASFIAMACGFWYDFSLANGEPSFGIDIQKRTAHFYDDGTTGINVSTLQQCGRALAGLLSLPATDVAKWANKPLYIDSFKVSQRDILDSLHRVLGTTDKDWEITQEPTKDRYQRGVEQLRSGDMRGFSRAMHARAFYPNGDGDHEAKLDNDRIGLKKENLDEVTRWTVQMIEKGWNPLKDMGYPE